MIQGGRPVESAGFVLRRIGAGRPVIERAKLTAGFAGDGRRVLEDIFDNHWRTVDALMERLELDAEIRDSVARTFERCDGKGDPESAKGPALRLPTRLVNLAEVAARHPQRVRSLGLLEPGFLFGPAGAAFAEVVAPLVRRYETGDTAGAVEGFLELVGTDRWRTTIEDAIPGVNHLLQLEATDLVADALGEFLRRPLTNPNACSASGEPMGSPS